MVALGHVRAASRRTGRRPDRTGPLPHPPGGPRGARLHRPDGARPPRPDAVTLARCARRRHAVQRPAHGRAVAVGVAARRGPRLRLLRRAHRRRAMRAPGPRVLAALAVSARSGPLDLVQSRSLPSGIPKVGAALDGPARRTGRGRSRARCSTGASACAAGPRRRSLGGSRRWPPRSGRCGGAGCCGATPTRRSSPRRPSPSCRAATCSPLPSPTPARCAAPSPPHWATWSRSRRPVRARDPPPAEEAPGHGLYRTVQFTDRRPGTRARQACSGLVVRYATCSG